MNSKYLYFCALGGLGEIGLNSSIYGYGSSIDDGDIILVDLGIKFAAQDFPGFDIIIPNINWINKNKKRIKGILLTHAHEDHIGALPYLWDSFENIKIYGSKFTIETVKEKIARINGDTSNLLVVPLNHEIAIGNDFKVQFTYITHSIPQSTLLIIDTPSGRVVHTGDWKIDETPVIGRPFNHDILKKIGQTEVLAMFCDSTNVLSKGFSGSENQVKTEMLSNLKKCKGRIVLTCFASNVSRIQIAIDIAKDLGRKLMIIGHSFKKFAQIAKSCGMLSEIDNVLVTNIKKLAPNKCLLLCSGSQGEPTGSLLRLSDNNHPDVELEKDDTVVFSSRVIPGNEKRFYAMQNAFAARGINILSLDDFCTHVSGHPYEGELRLIYKYICPKIAVPIHGESLHLFRHAKLALEEKTKYQFMLNNGNVLKIDPQCPSIVSNIIAQPMLKYGSDFISIDSPIVRERAKLSNGMIHLILFFNKDGYLDGSPIITSFGLTENHSDFEDEIAFALDEYLNCNTQIDLLSESKIKRILNSHFKSTLGIIPVIIVTVIS